MLKQQQWQHLWKIKMQCMKRIHRFWICDVKEISRLRLELGKCSNRQRDVFDLNDRSFLQQ